MSSTTRQRSFFDQNNAAKSRPQWQRNRDDFRRREQEQEAARKSMPKSPILASAQAKTKLKAFEFIGSGARGPFDNSLASNNENAPLETRTHISKQDSIDSMRNVANNKRSMTAPILTQNRHSDMPPSTPIMRLPLAELIGNAEDALVQPLEKEQSPEEHLGWVPNSSNTALTPNRRRKRARSSSPMASSQNDLLAHPAYKQPFESLALQHRTPQADPATELWNHYATGKEHGLAPTFAHLFDGPCSPLPQPRTPQGGAGGLRRWASCGTEWPVSRSRPRQIRAVYRDDPSPSSDTRVKVDQAQHDSARPSRLGLLVKQMQATLTETPSGDMKQTQRSSSPAQDHQSLSADRPPPVSQPHHLQTADVKQDCVKPDESDYGDDIEEDDLLQDDFPNEVMQSLSAQLKQPGDTGHETDVKLESTTLPTIVEDMDDFDDGVLTADDLAILDTNITTTQDYTQRGSSKKCDSSGAAQGLTNVHVTVDDDDDDDEFGGSDLNADLFAAAEQSATQAYKARPITSSGNRSRAIQRYLVKEVTNATAVGADGAEHSQKVLKIICERDKHQGTILLRQSWLDTHVATGAYVHVVGTFSSQRQIIIDDINNLLIVHPDHLVSATSVADSFDCLRKAVLQDRVKVTSATSKPTVYGSMLHEIFQTALQHNSWRRDWLADLVRSTVTKYVESLFEAGAKDTVEAIEHLDSKMPDLSAWAATFVRATPGPNALAEDRNGKKIAMSVSKLLDVEERVWSPMYGLKGNIDASVEVVMDDESGRRNLTVPFEVKTGKYKSAAHRAQTALYTLLLSDRYDLDVVYGILYYMDESSVIRIPAVRNELRHMVMQRNELASYVRERLELPPMLQNDFKCSRCYAKTQCFIYHKLAENGTTDSAGVKDIFVQAIGNLQQSHQHFFVHWDGLLTKEEAEFFKLKRELWTMLSHERARVGRAFSALIVESVTERDGNDLRKINRYSYTFVKQDLAPDFSFTESQIVAGEPIVVSSEQGHFALANGYVIRVSRHRITVGLDRRLRDFGTRRPGFNEKTNQVFPGLMELSTDLEDVHLQNAPPASSMLYRLDKDEFSNGMATIRNNLLAIMDDNQYRAAELRRLIVDDARPVFSTSPTAYTLPGTSSQLAAINSDQRAAIDKVMSAKDYALVLGMPGTGKTTTIAHIIRALVHRGKSVLLTSYTHTAVDNILLKLRDSDISVLRLGALAKVHPDVQAFARLAATPPQSIAELEEMYMAPHVVATTCLGVSHQIFQRRIFDYCIVDEASQITLPVCLGPIRMARTFILVGDHYQLPPLVQNKDAQQGGLDVSLFKLLSDRQPESVVSLKQQYRMSADVMSLSNNLIYDGQLMCGNHQVAQRKLELRVPQGLDLVHEIGTGRSSSDVRGEHCHNVGPTCWLSHVLDPDRRVVYANIDSSEPGKALETVAGSRITNSVEAHLVTQTVLSLLALGVPSTEVGVITFYRSQLSLLKTMLKGTEGEAVEMHTADKFQGRDKEVIVLGCVRSNESRNVGDLLRDWRRVNVALTRSRSKLIIFGSRHTLSGDALLTKFLELVDQKGWSTNLPLGADRAHDFENILRTGLGSIGTQKTTEATRRHVMYDLQGSASVKRKILEPSETIGNIGSRARVDEMLQQGTGTTTPKHATHNRRAMPKQRQLLNDVLNDVLGDEA